MSGSATAYAPGSIGNVGPGFDVLGMAVDGIGDEVTVSLNQTASLSVEVSGRDATLVPIDASVNAASRAAAALLRRAGSQLQPTVRLKKGLPVSGGLGGSAASAVAGAYAAALALGRNPNPVEVLEAAFEVESEIAGHHLDNVASILYGGLTLVLSVDPHDVVRLPVHERWWLALATPRIAIETKAARAILPESSDRSDWVRQMAKTTALAHALGAGDADLVRRSLDDRFAEPLRARLVPRFDAVKRAALDNGGVGCSLSGSGPTIFALAGNESDARRCAGAMQEAFGEIDAAVHVGKVSREGVRPR